MEKYKFSPGYEAGYAGLEHMLKFLKDPKQQSTDAYHAAQALFMPTAQAMRETSPLQPQFRPGMSDEGLSAEQLEMIRRQRGGMTGGGGLLGGG